MRKFFNSNDCFFLITLHFQSHNSNPQIFINELVNDAIKTLSDKNISDEEKTAVISKCEREC